MMYLILFMVAIIAFGISAVCGGGASFILLPVLGLLVPAAQVPAALSIGTSVSSLSRIAVFKQHVRWDIVVRFVPAAVPAVWLGARLLSNINPVWLEFLIGIFLVVNLPFIFKKEKSSKKRSSIWLLPVIGIATGFISGLTGAVGLLFNRFYLTYGLSKEEIIATRAANELLLHLIKIGLYAVFGLLTLKAAGAGLALSVAAIVSAGLMKRILHFFSENGFRRTGFIAMVLSGVVMLISSGHTLYVKEKVRLGVVKNEGGLEADLRTKQQSFAVEIAFNEGIELERKIAYTDLPNNKKSTVDRVAKGATIVLIEEVIGWGRRSHELYLYRNGKLEKHTF